MKPVKLFIITLAAIFISQPLFSQSGNLSLRQGPFRYRFYLDKDKLKRKEVKALFREKNPQSLVYFTKAVRSSAMELVTGIPGGFLLGIEATNIAFTGEVNYYYAGAGVALCALSTWYYYRKQKYYLWSVASYNKNVNNSSRLNRLGFGPTRSGGLGWTWELK